MSKALIIVTSTQSGDIYKEFRKKYSHSENNGVLKATVNSNRIFVVNKYEITDPTSSIESIVNGLSSFEIFICAHAGYINVDNFSEKVIDFGHTDDTGKELLKFAEGKVKFEQLIEYLEKKSHKNLTSLLHIFLSIDIDMQALEILLEGTEEQIKKTERERNEEAAKYLKVMLDESKKYHKRILIDAQELLNQIPEDKREKVQVQFNAITSFLNTLGNQQDQIPEKEFFNDDQNKTLKENIKSFHIWYCALDECLREEK